MMMNVDPAANPICATAIASSSRPQLTRRFWFNPFNMRLLASTATPCPLASTATPCPLASTATHNPFKASSSRQQLPRRFLFNPFNMGPLASTAMHNLGPLASTAMHNLGPLASTATPDPQASTASPNNLEAILELFNPPPDARLSTKVVASLVRMLIRMKSNEFPCTSPIGLPTSAGAGKSAAGYKSIDSEAFKVGKRNLVSKLLSYCFILAIYLVVGPEKTNMVVGHFVWSSSIMFFEFMAVITGGRGKVNSVAHLADFFMKVCLCYDRHR